MENNKGFIGLGLVLVIIGVLFLGGGAYYLGTKNSSVSTNIVPDDSSQLTEEQNDINVNVTNNLQQNRTNDQKKENSSEELEIFPNQVFTSYMKELYKAKDFNEQVSIRKKYESKRAISKLEKDILSGDYSTDSGKIGAFNLYKVIGGFFYEVTKTEVDEPSASIEASVRNDGFDSSEIDPSQIIKSRMIKEGDLWKVDTISIGSKTLLNK